MRWDEHTNYIGLLKYTFTGISNLYWYTCTHNVFTMIESFSPDLDLWPSTYVSTSRNWWFDTKVSQFQPALLLQPLCPARFLVWTNAFWNTRVATKWRIPVASCEICRCCSLTWGVTKHNHAWFTGIMKHDKNLVQVISKPSRSESRLRMLFWGKVLQWRIVKPSVLAWKWTCRNGRLPGGFPGRPQWIHVSWRRSFLPIACGLGTATTVVVKNLTI